MRSSQGFRQIVDLLGRLTLRLYATGKSSRVRVGVEALRFDGFAGSVLVNRDRTGVTVTLPRSDVVVYSSFLEKNEITEKGREICSAMARELKAILQIDSLQP
jgi:hypothetical protein